MTALTALRRIERVLLVTIFLSMVALYTLNVGAREIGGNFASRLAWIEEAVRILNLFLVFLALGLALERGRHVGMDTLRTRLPQPWRRGVEKLIDLSGLLFCAIMAWWGSGLVLFVLKTGQRSPTLELPMGFVYLAPVIGFGLLGVRFALSLLGVLDRFGGAAESDA